MNAKQKRILEHYRKHVKNMRAKEQHLKKFNEVPENQYAWDEWMVQSGFTDGLISGLASLEAFIKAGEE